MVELRDMDIFKNKKQKKNEKITTKRILGGDWDEGKGSALWWSKLEVRGKRCCSKEMESVVAGGHGRVFGRER